MKILIMLHWDQNNHHIWVLIMKKIPSIGVFYKLDISFKMGLVSNLQHEDKRSKSHPPQASFVLIVCFTSYFVFSIAILPHSPGVVYYHLLLRRVTRIPGVAPFSFRIGIWDLFLCIGDRNPIHP